MFKRLFSMTVASPAKAPKHLINIARLSNQEFSALVDRAQSLKQVVKTHDTAAIQKNHTKLLGKLVALLFSKRSTRTRISTEGAAAHFGAQPMFLGKDDIQLGVNESMYDTTRVVSSMTLCIFARVNNHQEILDLCQHSSVPIINALCDRYHPLQAIADILSVREAFGYTEGLKLAWVGDANNVINDLAVAALKSGMSVLVCIPEDVHFDATVEAEILSEAERKGGKFEIVSNPEAAVANANVVVTDTWVSMGQELEKQQKLQQFAGYQIDQQMLVRGGVADNWRFMHCLPRHAEEVADDVFYSENSIVFEEAENRLYAAMAVIESYVVKG